MCWSTVAFAVSFQSGEHDMSKGISRTAKVCSICYVPSQPWTLDRFSAGIQRNPTLVSNIPMCKIIADLINAVQHMKAHQHQYSLANQQEAKQKREHKLSRMCQSESFCPWKQPGSSKADASNNHPASYNHRIVTAHLVCGFGKQFASKTQPLQLRQHNQIMYSGCQCRVSCGSSKAHKDFLLLALPPCTNPRPVLCTYMQC